MAGGEERDKNEIEGEGVDAVEGEGAGMALLACGVLFFAGMDAAIKALAESRPALEVVAT